MSLLRDTGKNGLLETRMRLFDEFVGEWIIYFHRRCKALQNSNCQWFSGWWGYLANPNPVQLISLKEKPLHIFNPLTGFFRIKASFIVWGSAVRYVNLSLHSFVSRIIQEASSVIVWTFWTLSAHLSKMYSCLLCYVTVGNIILWAFVHKIVFK